MSRLVFDGTAHMLTLYADDGRRIGGPWPANNVVDRKATLRFVPNGDYTIDDPSRPFKHGRAVDHGGVPVDSTDGAYGPCGIIRIHPFDVGKTHHAGIGIHSGRARKGAWNHPTMGCIRTTDEAMKAISQSMAKDPLKSITVRNNHDQRNDHPKTPGDHHPRLLPSGGPIRYTMV